jgi:hypothetical protein
MPAEHPVCQEYSAGAPGIGILDCLNRINSEEIALRQQEVKDLSISGGGNGERKRKNVHLDYHWCFVTCYAHLGGVLCKITISVEPQLFFWFLQLCSARLLFEPM